MTMPTPGEHKTVQARILKYAGEIGWAYVPRSEAEKRRGFNNSAIKGEDRAKGASLYFDELLYSKVVNLNPRYSESQADLLKRLSLLRADIYGNRDFLKFLRAQMTYFYRSENRDLDLHLIDFETQANNLYEVTEEYYYHNGHYGNREDVVFLINGIPVLVIECKNADKNEAIALGIDQIRRYHRETPEFFVPQQVFTATDSIGFDYGVSWNTIRRSIFQYKSEEIGNLEAKIKSFCAIDSILDYLKDYIIFAEKDEQLNKYILRQHQTRAVEKVVERVHDLEKTRGLVWHTQGSGKTFTMIKAAEVLFKAAKSDKPTIVLMIDRNELEDQMQKNLMSLGINNVEHAINIDRLEDLLVNDYRGIIVTTIHKFQRMKPDRNKRKNVFVFIDEAHRTTGGDLGTYLMAALPNATYIGFSGTPIDKTTHGKGTFKTFGIYDEKGYLDKYSISESITDKTTLPLYYALAPNELLVPTKILEDEFLNLAENYGVTDIEELNKMLDRAVNIKNFLKADSRIDKVAQYVAEHYTQNVEPLGYKAFLVGVDRTACAKYKKALDKYLPADYSEVVYTGNNNDTELLKEFHIDETKERTVRREFAKYGTRPKILIVTEKLLTGFDAPILYAMYLDKPMRDHTLLQAIARVNRPYENEENEMVKPQGFVLDFVGIFDKLEKALAFDSEEIGDIQKVLKDIRLLKQLFKDKIEKLAPVYISLVQQNFIDKDVDNIIAYFRDQDKRKAFYKEYKELEMLFEIISPDVFLRPYLETFSTLSAIYSVVVKAYSKKVYIDKEFQKKTGELVQKYVDVAQIQPVKHFFELNEEGLEQINKSKDNDNTRVINLVKSVQKAANDAVNDPYLVTLSDRANQIQLSYEDRQKSTQETLAELTKLVEDNIRRKKIQTEKNFDGLAYVIFQLLVEAGVAGTDDVTHKIRAAFGQYPNWYRVERDMREVRKKTTFAIAAGMDDVKGVAGIVEGLFSLLEEAYKQK
jgi:type I restriction enzyme R subunit